ncbi:MAG: glycosyltransferase family 2 protein, partial [Pseudomonadota bacterium]
MIEDTAEPSTDQGPGPKPAPAAAGRRGVGVVIVNYATARLVIDALPPLLAELDRLEAAEPHRVVVVDNASPGPDVTVLSDAIATHGWGPRVRLVASPINGGFSAGNNLGFRALREDGMHPEAVLLHNPDAAVRPGALAEMLRVMRTTPSAGFVGPRQASPDGSSWSGAFPFPSLASEVAQALGINALAERYPTVIEGLEAPTRVDWVSGTATLIRGEALEALGDMDEGYFLYHEEVDYARRAAALGWESWHAPAAVFEHDAGSATGVSDG